MNQFNKTILIVGDVMLDEYIMGDVLRISPEAPVPVVKTRERKSVLGGAANIAANVVALNAQAALIGVVGKDNATEIFKAEGNKAGIDFIPVYSSDRLTTVKTRIVGNKYQIVRYDDEITDNISEAEETVLLKEFESRLPLADIVVISDYAKGICTERVCRQIIETAKKFGKHVFVDPKQSDWKRYEGAFLIKPNLREFYQAARGKLSAVNIEMAAKQLMSEYGISNVLITKSQYGMSLVTAEKTYDIQSEVKEVYDVSGAGDTVIATLAVFSANGMSLPDSIKIANAAAGIAVSKRGTYTVTLEELKEKLDNNENKIISNDDIVKFIRRLRKLHKRIVFTNGCFDILHVGHIRVFREAKKHGDVLIVGLNSDASVKRLKGEGRPVNSESDRAFTLSELKSVDGVIIFEEDTPYELIKAISPDVLVKGGDYSEDTIIGADFVKGKGGAIVIVPLVSGKSTSNTIKTIEESISVV
jgi:D-beta-D-heptose 7-phosphate kinase/D-beta-D-heptose 1-phosphate adenosyltransferase